mmetsp:Transcript_35144/g.94327  ORF Transcript_35144/g.94327 Transcript_35144/m.94327 type:complete len:351 (-) Transcript_35144:265-1317(-)
MLKPRVGETVSTGSPLNFLRMVVLPALSRPSIRSRISFSSCFIFRNIFIRPMTATHPLQSQLGKRRRRRRRRRKRRRKQGGGAAARRAQGEGSSVQQEHPGGDVRDEPPHALQQALASIRGARHDAPVSALDLVQPQEIPQLGGGQRPRQVLLVGEDQQCCPRQPLLPQQIRQSVATVLQPRPVGRVDHPHQAVGGLEVVLPITPDGLLPTHVPNVELVALVLERLDVEAQGGRDGVDGLPVELLEDGGLAGVIQAEHQEPHLLLLLLHLPQYLHQAHDSHPPAAIAARQKTEEETEEEEEEEEAGRRGSSAESPRRGQLSPAGTPWRRCPRRATARPPAGPRQYTRSTP